MWVTLCLGAGEWGQEDLIPSSTGWTQQERGAWDDAAGRSLGGLGHGSGGPEGLGTVPEGSGGTWGPGVSTWVFRGGLKTWSQYLRVQRGSERLGSVLESSGGPEEPGSSIWGFRGDLRAWGQYLRVHGGSEELYRFLKTNISCTLLGKPRASILLFICPVISDFATPWTAACQSYLSLTISWSLSKFMSIA